MMVAEAVRCLQEDIVEDANQLDIAMILGTGFAPFRGGLLRHADDYGLSRIVDELEEFRKDHGPRYAVPERLSDFAKEGTSFTLDD